MTEASELLVDLGFFSLDHGIDSVRDGGPLIPFVVAEGPDSGRALQRFVADRLEEAQGLARRFLADATPLRAALVYDGYLTVDGARNDAIFAEFFESGDPEAYILAQRYQPKGRLKKFATIGNAAFVGNAPPLF